MMDFCDEGKFQLELRFSVINELISDIFIECTEIIWDESDDNLLFVYVESKDMGWYLEYR